MLPAISATTAVAMTFDALQENFDALQENKEKGPLTRPFEFRTRRADQITTTLVPTLTLS